MDEAIALVIIGAGGHGRAVLDVAVSANRKVLAFIDEGFGWAGHVRRSNYPHADNMDLQSDFAFFVAIGDNSLRQKIVQKTQSEMPNVKQATLIHKTAYVSPYASLSPGCVVMGQAFIGPNCRIDEGYILNTASHIDHDGTMQEFSSLGPKACLGGTVKLGRRSIIAIGATVKHGLEIGDDSLLGAHSYLHQSMPDHSIYKAYQQVFMNIERLEINTSKVRMLRFFDILFSGTALIVLTPILLPVCLLLRITGEGVVFYAQPRIGRNGKVFNLLKFATMLKNSPQIGTEASQ